MFDSIHFFLVTAVLLITAVSDSKYKKIPNRYVILTAVLSLLNVIPGLIASDISFVHILSGVVAGGFLLLPAYLITGKSFGAGDVKLFTALGISLGAVSIIYLIGAAMAGALLDFLVHKKSAQGSIAMAPFILFSYIIINCPGI